MVDVCQGAASRNCTNIFIVRFESQWLNHQESVFCLQQPYSLNQIICCLYWFCRVWTWKILLSNMLLPIDCALEKLQVDPREYSKQKQCEFKETWNIPLQITAGPILKLSYPSKKLLSYIFVLKVLANKDYDTQSCHYCWQKRNGEALPFDAEGCAFNFLEFLFHLHCSWRSVHIFPLPSAFIGPVSHLQTLLATHMLFVCLSVDDKTDTTTE